MKMDVSGQSTVQNKPFGIRVITKSKYVVAAEASTVNKSAKMSGDCLVASGFLEAWNHIRTMR